jgi:hypothetical protein
MSIFGKHPNIQDLWDRSLVGGAHISPLYKSDREALKEAIRLLRKCRAAIGNNGTQFGPYFHLSELDRAIEEGSKTLGLPPQAVVACRDSIEERSQP